VPDLQFFIDLSWAALAVLVAVLAIYLALRLLGKFAKWLITVVVIALVLWFLFSNHSILQYLLELLGNLRERMGDLQLPDLGFLK
jgi:MFS superfamily sulfate permease-like transporter